MEKKKRNAWRFAFLALAVYGFLKILPGIWASILLLGYDALVKVSADQAVSVGIIGGADGPTAIFLTSPGWVYWLIPAAMIAVGLFGYFRLRKIK